MHHILSILSIKATAALCVTMRVQNTHTPTHRRRLSFPFQNHALLFLPSPDQIWLPPKSRDTRECQLALFLRMQLSTFKRADPQEGQGFFLLFKCCGFCGMEFHYHSKTTGTSNEQRISFGGEIINSELFV